MKAKTAQEPFRFSLATHKRTCSFLDFLTDSVVTNAV